MASRRWRELSDRQRHWIVIGTIAQLSLLAAALVDLYWRAPEDINGSRGAWTAAAFMNFVGPIAYFVRGRCSR